MKATWYETEGKFEHLVLVGDIGGTNTTLAIIGHRSGRFSTVASFRVNSTDVLEFPNVVRQVLGEIPHRPDFCCFCAAGPVVNNRCKPTNLQWVVDGDEIQRSFGLKTSIINDFQAVCYGVPLLDTEDPEMVIPIPHPGGRLPVSTGDSCAITGAGTGLGVGYLARLAGKFYSIPSEGGHTGFSPFDEETEELYRYIAGNYKTSPGTELFLSGKGMAGIFNFLKDKKGVAMKGILEEIDAAPDHEKPPLITKNTPTNHICQEIMRTFIRIYGNFASRVALFYLPTGGMFIAGGIVIRHAQRFLEGDLFIREFENSYNPLMRKVLESIPVYIVNDYSISLRGAAHAALTRMQ